MTTHVDLFSGMGGFRAAAESLGLKTVYACEIDKFARKTYEANYGTDYVFDKDIREATDIPTARLLTAGFPCQPFSERGVATLKKLGRKVGLANEDKGDLLMHTLNIINSTQPQRFILENVPGFITHDKGVAFRSTIAYLESMGYKLAWRLINSEPYVAQKRSRLFIVGSRVEVPVVARLVYGRHAFGSIYDPNAEKGCYLGVKTVAWLKSHAEKNKRLGKGFSYSVQDFNQATRAISARYWKDGSECVIEDAMTGRWRRLTKSEGLALFGYPMGYKLPVSNTQAFRQLGNSVVVPVVKMLMQGLIKGDTLWLN